MNRSGVYLNYLETLIAHLWPVHFVVNKEESENMNGKEIISMGRGLSDLQITMLKMAKERLKNDGIIEPKYVTMDDVLVKVYHWELAYDSQHKPHFKKSQIGRKKYMSAYMAVRKSLKRLDDRGLMNLAEWFRKKVRFTLTDKGIAYLNKTSQ